MEKTITKYLFIFMFSVFFISRMFDFSESTQASVSHIPLTESEEILQKYIDFAPESYRIWHYTKMYTREVKNVPIKYAINILRLETGYTHPLDFRYTPHQTSYAGAEGPYQIMPSTGSYVYGKKLSREQLRYDSKLNSWIGINYLSRLISRYGTQVAAGYYNTGYPIVNDYAVKAVKGIN